MGQELSMNVGDIMTRHVVTVSMDHTLGHVRELFDAMKFHHLIVTEMGKVVGVISDRDLLRSISPYVGTINERNLDRWSLNRKVHQIMTRRLISCRPGDSLAHAGQLMMDHRVHCLPVLDDQGGCAGILTMRDLLAWALVQCAGGSDRCGVPRAA